MNEVENREGIAFSKAEEVQAAKNHLRIMAEYYEQKATQARDKLLSKYNMTRTDLYFNEDGTLVTENMTDDEREKAEKISKADLKKLKDATDEILKYRERAAAAEQKTADDLGVQYVMAWQRNDTKRMSEILMDKMSKIKDIIPFRAARWYSAEESIQIANLIKVKNEEAIRKAAVEMARLVPENAVLVPMPPHTGKVTEDTDTMVLARAISKITGNPVLNALEGESRQKRKTSRDSGKRSEQLTEETMGFRQTADIPEGMVPYFIDNVVASGLTAKAAHNAFGAGVTLAFAKGTRSGMPGLKNVDPTFDDAENHLLIPLEDRYDMSKTGGPGTKFAMAEEIRKEEFRKSRKKYEGKILYINSEVYNHDFLVSLPDIEVTDVTSNLNKYKDEKGELDQKLIRKDALAEAEKYGQRLPNDQGVIIQNNYTGHNLRITGRSATHGVNKKQAYIQKQTRERGFMWVCWQKTRCRLTD